MDLDESILQQQYMMDDIEKEPIKYIYCIVLDYSRFLFTSDSFNDLKVEYEMFINKDYFSINIRNNITLVKINSNYFDQNNFEQSYKYFEEI